MCVPLCACVCECTCASVSARGGRESRYGLEWVTTETPVRLGADFQGLQEPDAQPPSLPSWSWGGHFPAPPPGIYEPWAQEKESCGEVGLPLLAPSCSAARVGAEHPGLQCKVS